MGFCEGKLGENRIVIVQCGMGKVNRVYAPNPQLKAVYERNYRVFKRLYKANAANFRALNGD